MLQWHAAGSWDHRAYWGENLIDAGVDGTTSRALQGALPTLGGWVRLEVPAAAVGLNADSVLDGMRFTLFDGQAAFGATGIAAGAGDQTWFSNILPAGAQHFGDEPWELLTFNDLWAPFEPTLGVLPTPVAAVPASAGAHFDTPANGAHQHFIENVTTPFTPTTGESLFCWVYLDPTNPPREVMLQWRNAASGWEHRAFWGFDLIGWGTPGQPSRLRLGPLPQPGQWVRLEVSAQSVGVENVPLVGIAFALFDGFAVFGAAGAGVRGSRWPGRDRASLGRGRASGGRGDAGRMELPCARADAHAHPGVGQRPGAGAGGPVCESGVAGAVGAGARADLSARRRRLRQLSHLAHRPRRRRRRLQLRQGADRRLSRAATDAGLDRGDAARGIALSREHRAGRDGDRLADADRGLHRRVEGRAWECRSRRQWLRYRARPRPRPRPRPRR